MYREIIDQNRQSILRLVDAIDDLVQEEKNRLEKFGETDRVLEKFHFTESNRLKFERVFETVALNLSGSTSSPSRTKKVCSERNNCKP